MIKRRFCSNDNKALIWNSLLNENVFDCLDHKYIPIIITNIDAKIYEIANNTIIDNTNILQLNKQILYFIYNFIENLKQNQQTPQIKSTQQLVSHTPFNISDVSTQSDISVLPKPLDMTSDKASSERLNEFSKQLNAKQTELQDILNVNIPEKPDFSDDINDEPIKGNIDDIINKMQQERDNDLALYFKDNDKKQKKQNKQNK